MYRAAFVSLLCVPALAWADPASVIESVEKRYATVDAIKADFTQTTQSELYGESSQTGSVVLQRPTRMRWDFADGKQYVTDGSTMWIKNPAEKQVLQMTDVAATAGSADSILQSLDKVSELFTIDVLEDTDAAKRLKLVPKGESQNLKEVELLLDGALVLQKVGILDAFETRTDIAFTNVDLGPTVSDATFAFQVPEGFEVIKN